ncbi:hypothetical protein G6L37_05920 [Agrobacterium rubi]|nr:hypothetical protein [Agrobacterium rubi]NTF24897.1 hypothetical protein [Agrobacterium rubi]
MSGADVKARRADVAMRERLLAVLGAPSGVTLARRPTHADDIIVVWLPSAISVPLPSRISLFEGVQVEYRVAKVIRAG